MKSFRTPLILFVVIVVLGVIAFWDEQQSKKETKQEQYQNRLITAEPGNVSRLVYEKNIEDESPLRIEAVKENDSWRIEQPLQTKADASEIQNLLKTMIDYRYERKLELENPQVEQYGLDKPRYRLSLTLDSGETAVMAIGNNLPVGYSTYVSTDDGSSVYVGSQYIATSLSKSLYDLRHKHFPIPSSATLQSFEYENRSGEKVNLSKEADKWVIVQPDSLKADQDEVEELLREIRQTQIREFLDDPSPAIRKALALSNPGTEKVGSIVFIDKDGEVSRIEIVQNADDLYAQLNDELPLMRLDRKLEELFNKSLWDFQFKNVFEFDSNKVEKAVIDDIAFEKRLHNWYRSDEPDSPKYFDHVRRLLVDLEFAKAKSLLNETQVKEYQLKDPDHVVTVSLAGDKELKADFWKIEAENAVLVKKSDDPTYYLVGSDILEDIAEKQSPTSDDSAEELENSNQES